MNMRKSIVSVAVSLGAASLLFAGNVFAQAQDGIAPSASVESNSIDPQFHVGTCTAKRVSYATSFVNFSTTSTAFVDLPNSFVTIFIGGASNVCIIVDYAAQAFGFGANTLMFAQSVRDGVEVGAPGEYQFVGGDAAPFSNSHSNQWVYPSVTPGFHTFKMQIRSNAGGSVSINRGNMSVHHK